MVATTSVSAKCQLFSPTAYYGSLGAPDFCEAEDLVVEAIDLRGIPVPSKARLTAPAPVVDDVRGRYDDGTLSYDVMDGLALKNEADLDEIDER